MRLSLALPARVILLRLWTAERQLESLVTPTVVAYICVQQEEWTKAYFDRENESPAFLPS